MQTIEQLNKRGEKLSIRLCRELKRRGIPYVREIETIEESGEISEERYTICIRGVNIAVIPERGSIHYQAYSCEFLGDSYQYLATAHETQVKALLDDILNREPGDTWLKNHNRKGA